MKVVKLKCPECNANLEVNSDLENITCNYCGATHFFSLNKNTQN